MPKLTVQSDAHLCCTAVPRRLGAWTGPQRPSAAAAPSCGGVEISAPLGDRRVRRRSVFDRIPNAGGIPAKPTFDNGKSPIFSLCLDASFPLPRRDGRATAMEDTASEISDWEVLSAASACGGGDDDNEVVIVSGAGGDVLHDHFAVAPASPDAEFPGEGGPWSEPGDACCCEDQMEGLELLDGFGSISRGSFDLAAGVSSRQPLLQVGGADETREPSVLEAAVGCGATWSAEGLQTESVRAELEHEMNVVRGCGELDSILQPAHYGVGETLASDATAVTDVPQSEASENFSAKLEDEVVDAVMESSCPEDVVTSDGRQGEEEEKEQGDNADAAPCCDESDGEVKDGALPLVQTPGAGEGEKQVVFWWRLPFRLLHYCAGKVKPVWSFSIAAALLGLVVLGRRMYRMKRKARGMPQIKIAFDDKRASQFADRAARLNKAFLVARRVPLLRTSSGAVLPWSMVQER